MAAQCGVNNGATMIHHHHHPHQFVSSNAYYGYVPVHNATPAPGDEVNGMDVDGPAPETTPQTQLKLKQEQFEAAAEERRRCFGARKRGFAHEEVAAYLQQQPRFKRFRQEAVVTNVFSMMQETTSGQKSVDWPRCTMSRHYYA